MASNGSQKNLTTSLRSNKMLSITLVLTHSHAQTLVVTAVIFSVLPREAQITFALSQSRTFEETFKDSQIQTKLWCFSGHLLNNSTSSSLKVLLVVSSRPERAFSEIFSRRGKGRREDQVTVYYRTRQREWWCLIISNWKGEVGVYIVFEQIMYLTIFKLLLLCIVCLPVLKTVSYLAQKCDSGSCAHFVIMLCGLAISWVHTTPTQDDTL